MVDLSTLPAPPKGKRGLTLSQLGLPPPPTGQQGLTLGELNKRASKLDTAPASLTPIADMVPRSQYNPEYTGVGNIAKAVGNIPSEVARGVETIVRTPIEAYKTVTDPSVQQNKLGAVKDFYKSEYDLAVKPLVGALGTVGNTFLGGLQKLIKNATGYDMGDEKAKEALDNIEPNLYDTTQTIQQMLVDNPLATAATAKGMYDQFTGPKPTQTQIDSTKQRISTSGHDYDAMIQSGTVPKESVFKPDGALQPKIMEHVISDIAGKLNNFKKGLGERYTSTVNTTNPTVANLQQQAIALVEPPPGLVGGVVAKVKSVRDARATEGIANEIANIENNYSKLRTANEYSKDSGAASRSRIAQTDVLVEAVDPEGTIRTKQQGGAVDQYRALTIEGKESVVRQNLVNEGKKVNLKQIERDLKVTLSDSGLEGADLIQALNGIKREIEGLRLRADQLDMVDLAKVHDAKIATTKNIDFNTPPETKTYRKAVARTYKEIVEEVSETNVKQVNTELQKYYQDLERLENLDGRKIKGGKLGKYFAQISGNIVGGAVGGAVGGPVGAGLGTMAGGEAAAFIKGRQMGSTFGQPRGLAPKANAVLDAAAEAAKAGKKPVDLKTPDRVIGAAEDVPKTKEVLKVENQIKRNVEAQKKAIAEKDFTLVATLKEIYGDLVDKLKELVKKARHSNNDGKRNKQ